MSTLASTRPLSQTFAALALTGVFTLGSAALGAAEADNAFETIPAGEADQIEATAAIMMQLQDKRQKNDLTQNGQLLRGVHPKSHGCVRAEFTVNSDISPQYRVGLFANPGQKYDAWIRYSNAAALREDDLKAPPIKVGMPPSERENGSRGMALKILDVEGSFLSKDNGQQTQDFLMINTPEFAFSDVRNYLRLNQNITFVRKMAKMQGLSSFRCSGRCLQPAIPSGRVSGPTLPSRIVATPRAPSP